MKDLNHLETRLTSPTTRNTLSTLVAASSLSINLVLWTFVGTGVGYALDRWLHTFPFGIALFFCVGSIFGFLEMKKEIRRIERWALSPDCTNRSEDTILEPTSDIP